MVRGPRLGRQRAVDDAARGRSFKPEDARTPALRRAAARVFDAVVCGRAHAAWRAFARKCRRLDTHAVRRAKARGLARFAFFAERRRAVRALVARARRNALFRGVLRFAHVRRKALEVYSSAPGSSDAPLAYLRMHSRITCTITEEIDVRRLRAAQTSAVCYVLTVVDTAGVEDAVESGMKVVLSTYSPSLATVWRVAISGVARSFH